MKQLFEILKLIVKRQLDYLHLQFGEVLPRRNIPLFLPLLVTGTVHIQ